MLCFASFCFDLFSHVLFCFVTTLFCFDPLRFVWVSIQFVQQSNNQSKYGEKYTIHKRDRQQVVGGRRGEVARLGGGELEGDRR